MKSILNLVNNIQEENPVLEQNVVSSIAVMDLQVSHHTNCCNLSKRFWDDPFFYQSSTHDWCYTTNSEPQLSVAANIRSDRNLYILCRPMSLSCITDPLCMPDSTDSIELYRLVDRAATEILTIGRKQRQADAAQRMVNGLLKEKEHGEQMILEYCINLYTRASFLYDACSRDLNNNYYSSDEYELFNYIQLLNLYINRYGKLYHGTVYRGAWFSDETLKLHLTSDINKAWHSPSYLSTSKSRQIAELYGNVLLIINIQKSDNYRGKAIDISKLSAISDEEEVLLAPKYKLFKERDAQFDPVLKKHIIYLTTTPGYFASSMEDDKVDTDYIKQKRKYNPDSSTTNDECFEQTKNLASYIENEYAIDGPTFFFVK